MSPRIINNINKKGDILMKVYSLLTGRGNNTLTDKNILDILGRPVLYYPANATLKSKLVSKMYCSSDDNKILEAASNLNHISIQRPKELAQPDSQHIECIFHALGVIEKYDTLPDILVVTLANNVTCKSEWIDACINIMLKDNSISSVVPIYKDNDHHPLRAKIIDKNNRLQMYEKNITGKISTNRQDLTPCYFLAHNFWVLNVNKLIQSNGSGQIPWGFMGDNIAYYEISESIDIHKEIDLIIAKDWIKNNYVD